MMRLLLAALVVAVAAPAGAQTCAGAGSFRDRAYQFFGSAGLSDHQRSYQEGFAIGGARAFGQIAVGTNRFDEFAGSSFAGVPSFQGVSFTLQGSGAYQLALGSVFLCPLAGVKLFVGPRNVGGTSLRYSEADVTEGLSVGVVAARVSRTEIIPTVSLALVSAHTRFSDAFGNATAGWDSYGRVAVSVGVLFGGEFSVVPRVAMPFGWEGASTTGSVTISFNFGHRDPGT